MKLEHIDQVMEIERMAFPSPWPQSFFLQELNPHYAQSFVSVFLQGGIERVVGYICAWTVHDECSVNKIACQREFRKAGIGTRLLKHLIKEAFLVGARTFFLEVRDSNLEARSFYQKGGFVQAGRRKGYYADTKEDAVVMALHLPYAQEEETDQRTVTC